MTVAGETHRCPPNEVLAAFVDGRLPRMKVVALTEHLSSCAECRFIVESASELQAEEQAESIEPQGRRSWRWVAVAAVVGVGLLLTPQMHERWQTHQRDAVMGDLAEVRLAKRLIEPRLTHGVDSGEWHQDRGLPNGDDEKPPDQERARSQAYLVLDETKNDHSAAGEHARGIAWLVLRNADEAIAALSKATEKQPKDAQIWSDLAAAYLLKRQNKEAIDAANRAIALDPKLNEARFNKALAINDPQKPAKAIAEWTDYLKHDPYGEWALEARHKRRDLKESP
jgi:tetratricopeptide (TPR) repeat protein